MWVDLPALSSQEGLTGDSLQIIEVVRDRVLPTLDSVEPVYDGGMDALHVTGLDFVFSEPVFGLDSTMFGLLSETGPVEAVPTSLGDGSTWRLAGWGLYTYPEGSYSATF